MTMATPKKKKKKTPNTKGRSIKSVTENVVKRGKGRPPLTEEQREAKILKVLEEKEEKRKQAAIALEERKAAHAANAPVRYGVKIIPTISTEDATARLLQKLREDPEFFGKQILGIQLWEKQIQIASTVMNGELSRTAVKSSHGIGKSFVSAAVAMNFLFAFPNSIVVTTAPTFRQVEKSIWKEIRNMHEHAAINLGGKLANGKPLLEIEKDRWYAFGFATVDGDKFQGLHAEHILIIVDEAAGVEERIFEAIEGCMTSGNARLLLLGNPTSQSGTFRKAFTDSSWNKFTVSAFDTPNFTHAGITIEDMKYPNLLKKKLALGLPYPGLVNPQWVASKYKSWGPDSQLFKTRILGEFVDSGERGLIPLSWIEQGIERQKTNRESLVYGELVYGIDVAEFGRDSSLIVKRQGGYFKKPLRFVKLPIMEFTGKIVNERGSEKIPVSTMFIDSIGVGTGVEGRLSELGVDTFRVIGGGKSSDPSKYYNIRSEMYWRLREALNPEGENPIGLPDDDELLEELANTTYSISSDGKIKLDSKEDIKHKIGRSPDLADAVAMTMIRPELFTEEVKVKKKAGSWGGKKR